LPPQLPVNGLQYEPSEHATAIAAHLLGPQLPPASAPASAAAWQYCPAGHASAQPVVWHAPSKHVSFGAHATFAHDFTQRGAVKVAFGLQTSSAAHGFGAHGSLTHAPWLQAKPDWHPKKLQLFSG
jgi:hypothetical protein